MLSVASLFPMHMSSVAISSVCLELFRYWHNREFAIKVFTPSAEPEFDGPMLRQAAPTQFLRSLAYRSPFYPVNYLNLPTYLTEQFFLCNLKKHDFAYVWPGYTLATLAKAKATGKPIVLERVNCTVAHTKPILDAAYTSLGVAPVHELTEQGIAEEQAAVELADYLFCPSLAVLDSYRQLGVPAEKLLLTSEGWSPQQFALPADQPHINNPDKPLVVLFVGSLSVRKGVHLLLRAWEKAGINGQLWLVGKMDPTIAATCQAQLNRPDVVHHAYTKDLGSLYRAADIFAIASLEEGSPLVTYMALGHGLPVLASPMGGGGVVREGVDGFLRANDDTEAWVAALRQLAADRDLRQHLGAAARQQAENYTWEKVAAQRAQLLKERLGELS